jgi:molybdopterin-containing oxidoreductase family membrane subunit
MIPDLAMARDRITKGWRHQLMRFVSFGWTGAEYQWKTLKRAVTVFCVAIIPVMVLMHSIVGWDFAMTLQAGWESTVFGPYFVSGALISGAAAVIIILAIVRKALHMEYFIRPEHFDGLGILLLAFSLGWAYLYFNDFLVPWYGNRPADSTILQVLTSGRVSFWWWLMIFGNVVLPWATLWFKRLRRSIPVMVVVGIFVNVAMYLERYLIVGVMLGINELPFNWGTYTYHLPEVLITIGAFSLVAFLFVVFIKLFPIIPVWEVAESQMAQSKRRVGRAMVPTRADME